MPYGMRVFRATPHRRLLGLSSTLRTYTCPYLTHHFPCQIRQAKRLHSTQVNIRTFPDLTRRLAAESEVTDSLFPGYKILTIPRGDSFLNSADRVQKDLFEDGHRLWGFVIYRCTYDDDAAWTTCLERLYASIWKSMHFYEGLELLEEERFNLTVFEDANQFDGASAQIVRQHFKGWRKHTVGEEQGTPEEIEARGGNLDYPYCNMAVRYRFFVQIDEAALRSIVLCGGDGHAGDAWVNLVEADWDPHAAEVLREEYRIKHVDMGLDLVDLDDSDEYSFPEIDGCTEENIGWMKVHYMAVIPRYYTLLRDVNGLGDYFYERPPAIGRA